MLQAGYYIVRRDESLVPISRPGLVRVRRGDWLVTNGLHVGVFDKDEELDWLPLTWSDDKLVVLDAELTAQLGEVVRAIGVAQLEREFQALMYVDDGAPSPPLPKPPLRGLGPYLRERRGL